MEQEACAEWTQDHKVFAALTFVNSSNILECLQEAGAVVNSVDVAPTAITPLHRQYPYYVAPTTLTLDRAAVAMVEGLYQTDYFAGDQKLGLVTFDHANWRYATQDGLVPALRRRGVSLADAAYLHFPANLSDYGQVSSDAANAALKFKSEGIDHVVFVDYGGGAALFFMQAAERQDYRPRYGLSGMSGNQVLADQLGNDAKSQLHAALSIGWTPTVDVREQDDPNATNSTRVRCLSIMRRAGVAINGANDKSLPLSMCDALWSLNAALHTTSVINQATYLTGMNELHGTYSPGFSWSINIDRRQHDAVSSVANLRFVDSCSCFKYLGRPYRI